MPIYYIIVSRWGEVVKRMLTYCICITVIVLITAMFVAFARENDHINAEFLASYGWEVVPDAIEYERITLPDEGDSVFFNYNLIQKEAGLDLTPYYSMEAERFTYIVKNYPFPTEGEVRANVLCVNSKPIAGDIMTLKLDGFMHSLVYPK